MSSFHQFYSVNHAELLGLIKRGGSDGLPDRIIQELKRAFNWVEDADRDALIRGTCVSILDKQEYHCAHNGLVYFGLMRLCQHKRIPGEGWKSQYSVDVLQFVKGTSIEDHVKEVFAGLVQGRDPFFQLMNVGYQDVVACFIRGDEPQMVIQAIDACEDFADGKIPDQDVEEIIFNEFLPTIGRPLDNGHCLVVIDL